MKARRALLGLALLLAAAACSDTVALPAGPSYDGGGHTIGGGKAPADTGQITTSSDTTNRGGGHTLGGG